MEKNPFIGQLDRKIKLVEKIPVRSTTGAEKSTDNIVAEPWAKMIDGSGLEDVEGKVRHLSNRSYIVRFNPVVKQKGTELTLIDENRRYEVLHIEEIGRKKHLELKVKLYE